MPRGAKLLDIQMQDLSPTLWALVDDGRTYVMRGIGIYGTGWTLDKADTDKYIATFQQGSYVWHAFDLGERA